MSSNRAFGAVLPDRLPPVVARVLLPHERRVVTVRYHPGALVVPSLAAFGGLIAAAVLSFMNLSGDALAIIWSFWGLAFVFWLLSVARYRVAVFVVTSQRLLLVTGFVTRDILTIPLTKVVQLGLRRSFMGRLLGYGQFVLDGADARYGIRNVNFLPYPEQLYLEVMGLIFKEPDEDST